MWRSGGLGERNTRSFWLGVLFVRVFGVHSGLQDSETDTMFRPRIDFETNPHFSSNTQFHFLRETGFQPTCLHCISTPPLAPRNCPKQGTHDPRTLDGQPLSGGTSPGLRVDELLWVGGPGGLGRCVWKKHAFPKKPILSFATFFFCKNLQQIILGDHFLRNLPILRSGFVFVSVITSCVQQ